jgi:hypothetical protein
MRIPPTSQIRFESKQQTGELSPNGNRTQASHFEIETFQAPNDSLTL